MPRIKTVWKYRRFLWKNRRPLWFVYRHRNGAMMLAGAGLGFLAARTVDRALR